MLLLLLWWLMVDGKLSRRLSKRHRLIRLMLRLSEWCRIRLVLRYLRRLLLLLLLARMGIIPRRRRHLVSITEHKLLKIMLVVDRADHVAESLSIRRGTDGDTIP